MELFSGFEVKKSLEVSDEGELAQLRFSMAKRLTATVLLFKGLRECAQVSVGA